MSQIKNSTIALLSLWIAIPLVPVFAIASQRAFDGVGNHYSYNAGYPVGIFGWTVDHSSEEITAWNIDPVGVLVNFGVYFAVAFSWLLVYPAKRCVTYEAA